MSKGEGSLEGPFQEIIDSSILTASRYVVMDVTENC
jgi:hypothetical protein